MIASICRCFYADIETNHYAYEAWRMQMQMQDEFIERVCERVICMEEVICQFIILNVFDLIWSDSNISWLLITFSQFYFEKWKKTTHHSFAHVQCAHRVDSAKLKPLSQKTYKRVLLIWRGEFSTCVSHNQNLQWNRFLRRSIRIANFFSPFFSSRHQWICSDS